MMTSSLRRDSGFTLIEMIVVTLLLAIAMLGLLAVFDASARINKNETDVADAQGAVRYGVYQMTRVIRMAGSGGLFVTQAVLNHADRRHGRRAPPGQLLRQRGRRTHRPADERPQLRRAPGHGHDRDPRRDQFAPRRLRRPERLQPVHGVGQRQRPPDHRQRPDRTARQQRCGQAPAVRGDRRLHRDCPRASHVRPRRGGEERPSHRVRRRRRRRLPIPADGLQRRRDHQPRRSS